jgi:hypothetical protein
MDTNVWLPSYKRWPVTRRGCEIAAPHLNLADQIVKPLHRVVWCGEDGHITAIRQESADYPCTDESGGTRYKGFSHGQPFLPSQVCHRKYDLLTRTAAITKEWLSQFKSESI